MFHLARQLPLRNSCAKFFHDLRRNIHFYNFCYKKLRISLIDGKSIILCKQCCKIWLDVLINCTKSSFMDVVDFKLSSCYDRSKLLDGMWIILCKQCYKIWLEVLINSMESSFMDVVDFIIKIIGMTHSNYWTIIKL